MLHDRTAPLLWEESCICAKDIGDELYNNNKKKSYITKEKTIFFGSKESLPPSQASDAATEAPTHHFYGPPN